MSFDESPPYQYCIYYRIHDNVDHNDLCITVRQMQQTLQSLTSVPGRLMWRAHDDRTWMELYENVSDTGHFENTLAQLVQDSRLHDYIAAGSARHMERFIETI